MTNTQVKIFQFYNSIISDPIDNISNAPFELNQFLKTHDVVSINPMINTHNSSTHFVYVWYIENHI